ncbi:hypothetical protein [Actinocorallia sp. A-T 12471]|uniref:hypothetical protein n=1 Tax=Actinocorallia sp. A-T 12471 TaxID=3089813 RepID=UPI0029D17B3B|nr:hypothetical protein [Actinocorallia sp. A-T 12471]MDX6738946.1 hypothetical protein [Actinocorallia sp. A-T 12471]
MSVEGFGEGGWSGEGVSPRLSPLPGLRETYLELLRIEVVRHPHMGAGVVLREGRRVLFVVHGETGRLADIDLTVEGDAHWYTWALDHGPGRPIGTPARSADVAATIVKALSEATRPDRAR